MNTNIKSPRVPVGVLGGSGYTGLELLRVLGGHDGVDVRFATSDSEAGHPTSIPGLAFVPVAEARLEDVEVVFLCVPHGGGGGLGGTERRARSAGRRSDH